VTAVYVAPVSAGLAVAGAAAGLEAARREADEQITSDMRRRAEEFSREFGVPIAFIAVRGDPFTELRRVAEEIHADAVVVGASAHAGHRLVGSLAVRLVKAARWPVTVVPEPGSGSFGSSPGGSAVRIPPGPRGEPAAAAAVGVAPRSLRAGRTVGRDCDTAAGGGTGR